MKAKVIFNTDEQAATVYIMKILNAKATEVWSYFTDASLLERWWAPEPWKAETLEMNFAPGGVWKYKMTNPENQTQYAGLKFHEINSGRSFDFTDFMADEQGKINSLIPTSNWLVGFTGVEEGMKLTINIHFGSEEEMNTLMQLGFEERVLKSLEQLENILKNPES